MSCGRPDCRKKFVTLAGRSKHINHNESCRKWWLLRIVSRKVEPPPYEMSSEIASDEECFRLDESENLMMENGNPFSITDLHDDSSLLRENHCTLERGRGTAQGKACKKCLLVKVIYISTWLVLLHFVVKFELTFLFMIYICVHLFNHFSCNFRPCHSHT